MESDLAALAPLPTHAIHSSLQNSLTMAEPPQTIHSPTRLPADSSAATASTLTSWLDTPARVTDHGVPSNIRDTIDDTQAGMPSFNLSNSRSEFGPLNQLDPFADMADEHYASYDAIKSETETEHFDMQTLGEPSTPSNGMLIPGPRDTPAEDLTHEGYAMLRFQDCYCVINSLELMIIRDENYYNAWKAEKKEQRRIARAADAALEAYAAEPSQPSHLGDEDRQDPSSKEGEGESLEGRPARGLLSHYSEQGGPAMYQAPSDHEEEIASSRRRHRNRKNKVDSSSANSIAPQSLHLFDDEPMKTYPHIGEDGTESDPRERAALPVHTAQPEDIKKISREHLLFHYNSEDSRWEMDVIGRTAVLNGERYEKGTKNIELHHNDEIFISSVVMYFMLPATGAESDDEDDDEHVLESVEHGSPFSTSPACRLSNAIAVDESGEEDDQPLAQSARPAAKPAGKLNKIKIKMKPPKPAAEKDQPKGKGDEKEKSSKASGKKPKSEAVDEHSKPAKKPEKGKKPAAAAAPEASKEPTPKPKPEHASPPVPVNLAPGSVLENLAPEQIPEKRKGPGRPPKNGVLSKRDDSGIKRKQKEYWRLGREPPDINTLLAEVRAEQRAKDAVTKAQARGEPVPDMPVPSIEASSSKDMDGSRPLPVRGSTGQDSRSPAPVDGRMSPKPPRRVVRSPSPIKPESEFTEEDLKKPNMTYIYIIDEILQSIEGGQADLQTIYDKIQKRWPFYKYRVGSVGWQSSVRHNLLSCDRFKDAGKSGKGKFWTINFDHPLDNKKRKPTPPPRPMPPPMANGQMPYGMPNMHGQPQYPAPYGQQPVNGQMSYPNGAQPGSAQYHSPYAHGPPGNYGPHQGGPPNSQMGPLANGSYNRGTPQNLHQQQMQGSSRPPSQQPPPPPNPFQPVVDAIMGFRTSWLKDYEPGTPDYDRREDLFKRGTDYFSNLFHSGAGAANMPSESEANGEPFRSLKEIFEQNQYLFVRNQGATTGSNGTTSATAPAPAPAPANGPGQTNTAPPPNSNGTPNGVNGTNVNASVPAPAQSTVANGTSGAIPESRPMNTSEATAAAVARENQAAVQAAQPSSAPIDLTNDSSAPAVLQATSSNPPAATNPNVAGPHRIAQGPAYPSPAAPGPVVVGANGLPLTGASVPTTMEAHPVANTSQTPQAPQPAPLQSAAPVPPPQPAPVMAQGQPPQAPSPAQAQMPAPMAQQQPVASMVPGQPSTSVTPPEQPAAQAPPINSNPTVAAEAEARPMANTETAVLERPVSAGAKRAAEDDGDEEGTKRQKTS